ncbi:MAG: TldD/PmbA family protein, partial [Acidimicrobiales bacterium]
MPNDDEFATLPFDALRSAALGRASELGCERAELRVSQLRTQILAMRDARVEGTVDDRSVGMGLRVIKDGSIGFAATVAMRPDDAAGLAEIAAEAARITASAGGERVELADEPPHGVSDWVAPHRHDPTEVPLQEKVTRFESWSADLLRAEGVDHVTATLMAVAEDKYYADSDNTVTTQRRVRLHPSIEALAVGDGETGFETMRTVAPPVGRGYEYLDGEGWDFEAELATIPGLLAEKRKSPSVEPGAYDLVIDPTNLWLTIHESVGHATELDRALGYEAAYAGTSFATFDKLGSLKYGSELMSVTGDRTTPYGLATVAYDDEGVGAQSFDLVKSGVLVGYQLDRRFAKRQGFPRSNGCAFADSPLNVPMQRMANVSLRPAANPGPSTEELISSVESGIYIVGDKSWSI